MTSTSGVHNNQSTSRTSSPTFLCQSRGTCPLPPPPSYPLPFSASPDGYGMYRPQAGRSGSSRRHSCGSSSSISAAARWRKEEGRGVMGEGSAFRPRSAFRPLACSPRLRHLSRGDTIRSFHAEVCLPSEQGSGQDARVCYSRDTVMGVSFVSANKVFRMLSCLFASLLPFLLLQSAPAAMRVVASSNHATTLQPRPFSPSVVIPRRRCAHMN